MTSHFRLPKRWLTWREAKIKKRAAMKTETKRKNLIGRRWRHISVDWNADWLNEKRKPKNGRQERRKWKRTLWLGSDDVTFPFFEALIGRTSRAPLQITFSFDFETRHKYRPTAWWIQVLANLFFVLFSWLLRTETTAKRVPRDQLDGSVWCHQGERLMTLRNGTGPPLKKHLRRFGSQERKKKQPRRSDDRGTFFFL